MTTEQEINDRITKEYLRFNNMVYDGPRPYGLVDKFRRAIMLIPQTSHKLDLPTLKKIISKSDDQLTWLEIGIVINTIIAIPYEVYFPEPEEALDYFIELKETMVEYNERVSKKQKELEGSRERQLKMSGVVRPMNGKNLKN